MKSAFLTLISFLLLAAPGWAQDSSTVKTGPVRVLFVGHEAEHHPSDLYYPILSMALGRDAIYFDYARTPEAAFGDADYLAHFDAVLLYANHAKIDPAHWQNLKDFVENGGGFVPVHCASWCFQNIPEFEKLVGGRFKSHQTGVFAPKTLAPEHPAIKNVPAFEAWDETYFHENHNPEGRTVLQVREPMPGDPNTAPEPWTWVREQGKGRVFYTASGHDERVWNLSAFQQLLKSGILWSVGDARRASYEQFLAARTPLQHEKRGNIANYEKRPEPLPYQLPLSAEDSLKYTQVPVEFRIELFAKEPDIINPIGLAWDERGRLWAAETVDYPNEVREEGGNDKIKILEDTNGDGRCDKVTIFAEGLNIPTSLTFANGGIIVAQAPDFLFLKDTDGDDKADVRQVLFSGWGKQDTHAGPSNLRYGFDNWIWGTVGYSAYNGPLSERFGNGVWRMKPDGSKLEFLHQFNNNTWGLGFNETGDVFGSTANNNPTFFCGLPQTVFGEEKRMSAKMIADSPKVHPITPNIRQVDVLGGYTAACGNAFATSAAFPPSYRNQVAFVAEPTARLLGKLRYEKEGPGWVAKNEFAFVASADEWFSPVAAEVGPDGNLWIADWYDFIIQHNPVPSVERGGYQAENGKGNAHINPNRDAERGRIYRVIWEKAPKPSLTTLANATTPQLVAALSNDNLFWRQTAQRLLVERKASDATGSLRSLVNEGGVPGIHALWVLEGIGQLDKPTHQAALLKGDAGLRRNAVKALGTTPESVQLFYDSAIMTDKDPQVRLAAFAKLAAFPKNDTVSFAATQLFKNPDNSKDEWLSLALKTAGGAKGLIESMKYGENLIANASFEEEAAGQPVGWQIRNYNGKAEHGIAAVAKTGTKSLRIESKTGADTSWFSPVKLKPETEYRLTAWVKTEKVTGARGAMLNIHEIQPQGKTNALQKDQDWTQVECFFNSGNRTSVTVNLLLGGWGQSKGVAYYDDVTLQEATPVYADQGASSVAGDIERGKKIFHEHQIAACIRCHMLGGQGSPVGPALDGIASNKDEAYLRQSLVDPQAVIAEGFKLEISPMPPMGVLLKEQDFADVLAYLMTLK